MFNVYSGRLFCARYELMALIVSVNLAESVEDEQVVLAKPESLPIVTTMLVPVTELPDVSGVLEAVAVIVSVTLMITHSRESLSICMIKPAGFLITKLPR